MKKFLMSGLAAVALMAGSIALAGECCDKAKTEGHACFKCHPEQAKTCCEKAMAKDKDCSHPCCVEAKTAGKVCEKCNPPKKDAASAT
jgi:hypothetical protein